MLCFSVRCISTSLSRRVLSVDNMSLLIRRVEEVNSASIEGFCPFVIEDKLVGYVNPKYIPHLIKYDSIFQVKSHSTVLTLAPSLESATEAVRTRAISVVTQDLRDLGIVKGWRDELLPVVPSFSSPPLFLVERAAYPIFGVKGYGVHVNGFVWNKEGTSEDILLWVATRAASKSTWPSMLDHIVAGGQPYGITPTENMIKECGEEACIPPHLAKTAIPTGAVSYTGVDESGNLKRDTLFTYDLQLPSNFTPKPVDGEVEGFTLKNIDWVLSKLLEGGPNGYKPNCNLVVIDFLIRHGVIAPESERYLELCGKLRSDVCS